MSQTLAGIDELSTVADLLHHLGDVPAERIRLRPHPGTATEADVVRINERKQGLVELVDGVLVEKAMGFYESHLAMALGYLLQDFLKEHDLGIVVGADGMMRLAPGLVRLPDVAFLSWEKFPNREIPREPIPDLAPDLAVEVISQGNTPAEMNRKCGEYFDAGVRLVWYLYPKTRTMDVFTQEARETPVSETISVDGGEVLPGFRLSLDELFAAADRSGG
ncbi:MAG: Uma2 family endonuclease [Planctomycetes bacterium]|nr:Uma2 family endonuclease [Planctomycetota bacterium]